MPNIIDANGLQTKTQAELIEEFTTAMQTIYGPDINMETDTPDGQQMLIYVQAALDNEDLLRQIYNSFDPDFAFGKVLDQRVAINGIQRKGGTYTIQPVSVTVDRALTLPGLDQDIETPFTVSDNAGNEFELQDSYDFSGAGTQSLTFRAKLPGAVLTVPNTITNPVTIVLGVTTINNPSTYTTLGINEETDYALKIRRQKSVAFASQGYLESLIAALNNINGVNFSMVYENNTGTTDGDGIPGHSIWVIVSGGTAAEIGTAIYQKRNAGCGMKGAETYTIDQVTGVPFTVRWDEVDNEDLYIEFDASSLNGIDAPDTAAILAELPNLLVPGVYEQVNINDLATLVQQIDNNCLVTNAGFADNGAGPFTPTLTPSAKNKKFSVTSGNINITVV